MDEGSLVRFTLSATDANGDGSVTSADALMILKTITDWLLTLAKRAFAWGLSEEVGEVWVRVGKPSGKL